MVVFAFGRCGLKDQQEAVQKVFEAGLLGGEEVFVLGSASG